jgi:REP element-mobilizing transposase RayT
MPCYLFTYHGHGTWLPDHQRGYVRRKEGVLATDVQMASHYRSNLQDNAIEFTREMQQVMIDALQEACSFQDLRGHYVATESTHVHILVSWNTNKTWEDVRRGLRNSLTRQVNRAFEKREWFSKQPSRKRVADRKHFDYLVETYLPRHRGLKWRENVGVFS